MKWRPFEYKGVWLTGEITKSLYDEVFVTFWNYNGRLDVTHCPIVPMPSGRERIVTLGERTAIMEEVAWMPAALPKPFSNESAETSWIPIHQGLPKLGADVFVTVELPNKYLIVKHARLIPCGGDSCRFRFVSGWDYNDKIITAWMPAKIPKPYKFNDSESMTFEQ